MATKILKCGCMHDYQDKKYGRGNRVHNKAISKASHEPAWRCTVCGDKKG